MDRRFILAIVLMMVVLVVPSLFLKRSPARQPARPGPAGSVPAPLPAAPEPTTPVVAAPQRPAESIPQDTVTVTSPLYRYVFSTRGARLFGATLLQYRSMRRDETGLAAQILHPDNDFLRLAVLTGRDTIRLSDWAFAPSARSLQVEEPASLTFTASGEGGRVAELTFGFVPDDYRIQVRGSVRGLDPAGATLLIGLGPGLRNTESDSVEHSRELGIVTKDTRSEITRFGKLKAGQPVSLNGPFEWVAIKSKYFTTALLSLDTVRAGHGGIGGARVEAADREGRSPERADIWTSIAVASGGDFGFSLYVGPMEYPRLRAVGHDFDDINPYGWAWLRPIIRPVAIGARWLLVWFHERLGLAYGLGLMVFGILIRIVLWPLNQKAMRAGMQMQAIQPVLKEIQEKYKNEPQRLQQEMFKVYKEHKVNPFSGCWPLLLPWPILIALFFVFQNSIELRGASFLWLPDLSRPDPLYIIPVIMGVSMFAVTKVGQLGLPPNPQMKAMLYVMPGMMIVLFLGLASGLNLYYATVNVASIPQQWLVAKARLKSAPPPAPPTVAAKPRKKQLRS
jgi:YidC/Oxa1 family membrane protein insertase